MPFVKREELNELKIKRYKQEERKCLKCERPFPALGKIKNGKWFRVQWVCDSCKNTDLFKSPGLGKFEDAEIALRKEE